MNQIRTSLFVVAALASSLTSCQKNTVTGRSQLILVDESHLMQLSADQYKGFLKQNKVVPSGSNADQAMVVRVGNRLAAAVHSFLRQKNQLDLIKDYKWEFNLVEDRVINAWCMPGGKVVVYTGLLPVTRGEAGLAVVMGHEVAHAIARHGNERMSQGLLQQAGGVALSVAMVNQPVATQNMFMNAYGVGSQVGALLPFSRKHELEADRFGLIFAALAGFNVDEAVPFWERMAKASAGAEKPPELFSTHPSDDTRIAKVREYAIEAKKYASTGAR